MTSYELRELQYEYIVMRDELESIINETLKAENKLSGTDIILNESYKIDNQEVDNDYIRKSIKAINQCYLDLRQVSAELQREINSLDYEIDRAIEEEEAEEDDSN